MSTSTTTTIVESREQLDWFLLELDDRGEGSIVAFDGTTPYLLAACELSGESRWDAFHAHPYATENDPDGLEQDLVLEYELEEEDRWDSDNLRLYGISPKNQYPGLDALRYPLTLMHPALEGETPYIAQGAIGASIVERIDRAQGEAVATDSPQERVSDANPVTLVAFPTELLQRSQAAAESYNQIFLDLDRKSDIELWEAFGKLEPIHSEILSLVAKASASASTHSSSIQKD